jgi:beta-barrel assembly-enhancing protease
MTKQLANPFSLSRLSAAVLALFLLCPAALPPATAQNRLPALGDPSSDDFSIATEKKLGNAIMREVRADPDYIDDPVLLEALQRIWQPLVSQAKLRGTISADVAERLAWEPFLVRDRSVNAFALPGGFVGVHLGLMAITDTPDALASVLAHELSHITQRHIARSISNSKQQSLVSLATLLVGVLVASRTGSAGADVANATIVSGQALAAQGQLNFSRDMEREADRVGFSLLSGAGFAPSGMVNMFEKLDQSSRLNDSGGFPYLRSHPLTTERIGEARARLGVSAGVSLSASSTAPPTVPATTSLTLSALEHSLIQARARVLMDSRSDALHRWQALDTANPTSNLTQKLANAYTSALASTLLRSWARADAAMASAQSLLRSSPRVDARAERLLALLQAQSWLARGDKDHATRAAASLDAYAKVHSRPVMLLTTQAALAAHDAELLKQNASELQTWTTSHPQDSLAWTALSQTEERLGRPLRALRADAESRAALQDFSGALERLQAGQRRARSGTADFVEASVIDARLREVTLQRKTQEADEKALK